MTLIKRPCRSIFTLTRIYNSEVSRDSKISYSSRKSRDYKPALQYVYNLVPINFQTAQHLQEGRTEMAIYAITVQKTVNFKGLMKVHFVHII